MAPARRQATTFCVALITCAATVTSVTWLSALAAHHHEAQETVWGQGDGYTMIDADTGMLGSRTGQKQEISSLESALANVDDLHKRSPVKIKQKDKELPSGCNIMTNTEYPAGDVVAWGPLNKKASAEECCLSCKSHNSSSGEEPCKYWVFCGDKKRCRESFGDCWLKTAVHVAGLKPERGPHVKWTSGVLDEYDENVSLKQEDAGGPERAFHVVATAQGPPTHWQARVAYYWYKKIQKQCQEQQEVCHMGGWTRLLHSGEPDDLMEEIPTVVVRPLEDKDHKGYVVLNRPWAFVQWLRDHTVPEKYILMSEPDHLWMKPMPNIMKGDAPAAFPFFYIDPTNPKNAPLVQRFTGPLSKAELERIPPIGNAPTLLAYTDLQKLGESWMNTTHAIFDDDEVHKAWNWVLEMWGFAITTLKVGLKQTTLHWKMMCQIPYDEEPPEGPEHFIMHYTYGMDYRLNGQPMFGKIGEWRFDKRTYAYTPIPRNLSLPPAGVKNRYVWRFIEMLNEATEMIPGWDEYQKTGVAKHFWDGKTFKN